MRDKYLYFGIDPAATMAFDNHTAQTLQLTTGGFDNPLDARRLYSRRYEHR